MKSRKPVGKANPKTDHKHVERVKIDCACDREISLDELMDVFPSQKKEILEKYLPLLNNTFKTYEINSCMRKIHFLAQVGHESGSLGLTAEVLPKGKTEEKSYGGYKGRGLIQLTFKDTYKAYGDYIGQDLLDKNRLKLENPELATDSAGWYWLYGKSVNLNTLADTNDLIAISIAINGGLNGFDHRHRLLKNAYNSLNVIACKALAPLKEFMPEEYENSLLVKEYKFSESKAFNNTRSALAWGYWHDPQTKVKGVEKNIEKSKEGYQRFVDLSKTKPLKSKAFGSSPENNLKRAKAALGLPIEDKMNG
ncbi:glycoside hydrolase family 19 protein [Chromobacterium violaceum]|uniref:glycoside hydrolase family 19 protein n=1 Tax=Chromobacterium violaceum TaxID=536 RepID=UPI001CE1E36D|nr:glycoside hydrolase family 19 protein [Chromobacterium violaceum]